ncbi:MAG: uroporphyrinogen methyltransferase / synthase, partial [Actinomycetota bacterium]|nr:uroporphyrinogen methyltransferase / synthase [Actinomycetota bacterium]
MTVYLVGAGPGDPGLLTVRGAELLRRADVVVYDRLASPALLDLARESAELVDVGKAPGRVAMTQEQINELLVERGRAGLEVVRLKGGDPFVFGRGGEEAEACRDAGVAFEVVPGITSAIAAPAYAGIPVTHRGLSTSVTIVPGHEDPAKGTTDTDWEALARAGGTIVVLMGAGRVSEIAKALIAGGRDATTPVAAVRWGTRPEQRTVRATLASIDQLGVEAPSAIVVGAVAGLDLGWFEQRPLFGRSIAVTRAREQASELRTRLEQLGAEVIELPSIALEPVEFSLPAIDQFSWLVFTSANGVNAFFDRG